VVDESPKIRGLPGEPALAAEHIDDLKFAESVTHPANGLVIAELQDAGDGIGRVGNRVKAVKVDVPEQQTQILWDQIPPPNTLAENSYSTSLRLVLASIK